MKKVDENSFSIQEDDKRKEEIFVRGKEWEKIKENSGSRRENAGKKEAKIAFDGL